MSEAASRLKAMRAATAAEKDVKVFGGRDPFLSAGISGVSPNRYLLRIKGGTQFETKAKTLSNKVTAEVVAVLASGYDASQKINAERYAAPNEPGETVCLIAGKLASDEMVLKDLKQFVAAIKGIDGRKLQANVSNYIIYPKEDCDAILAAATDEVDEETLQAFPELSYAVLFAANQELPDPATADDEDDILNAAIEAKILSSHPKKKLDREGQGRFLATVKDLCAAMPLGLDYAERWKNSYMLVDAYLQQNTQRTHFYGKIDARPASDALLEKYLTADAYKAYLAYKQLA